nr:diaminopropionate ammonia-lyase [Quercus suber]
MSETRRQVIINQNAHQWTSLELDEDANKVLAFHKDLPQYRASPLISLHSIAQELGVQAVYVKDESNRFGLPSFKILGASWAVYRAIVDKLRLAPDVALRDMTQALSLQSITLFAATDGNHGRAIARMGNILSIQVDIHVPANMHAATIDLIRHEGANVITSTGNYDQAVVDAEHASKQRHGGILIQDFAFDGYEQIPQWTVDGYKTMMLEIDQQLDGIRPDFVFTPVGVGSFAHAVVSHFKREGNHTSVIAVEPEAAACLWESLKQGGRTSLLTGHTIMSGMECGTVSKTAWPFLRDGVSASLMISDLDSHVAVLDLKRMGVSAGPCGAASLAALRLLTSADRDTLGFDENSVVVLMCTEGPPATDDVSSKPAALTVCDGNRVTLSITTAQQTVSLWTNFTGLTPWELMDEDPRMSAWTWLSQKLRTESMVEGCFLLRVQSNRIVHSAIRRDVVVYYYGMYLQDLLIARLLRAGVHTDIENFGWVQHQQRTRPFGEASVRRRCTADAMAIAHSRAIHDIAPTSSGHCQKVPGKPQPRQRL